MFGHSISAVKEHRGLRGVVLQVLALLDGRSLALVGLAAHGDHAPLRAHRRQRQPSFALKMSNT